MTGLVSILMLTWNSSQTLPLALESLLFQTYREWEALVLDDASEDDSVSIVRSYAMRDNRIRFIGRMPEHRGDQGIGPLRNRCMSHAYGEYVAVLDADDVRYPGSLATLVQAIKRSCVWGIMATQYDEIDESNQVLPVSSCLNYRLSLTGIREEPLDITDLIRTGGGAGCPIAPCAALLRRVAVEDVGGFSQTWRYHTDSNLYRRIARLSNWRVGLIGVALSGYRVHPDQRSRLKRKERWVEPDTLD